MIAFLNPLSSEEESKYLREAAAGNENARKKLIEHNMRLVAHIAKKYTSTAREPEDLISIGTVGLIKGIDTYSERKGSRLATYCARCIENAILSQMCLCVLMKQSFVKTQEFAEGIFQRSN